MIIATAASFAVIGMLLWLLFTLAVYALPFYAGLSAALWAYGHDAGFVGAPIVGLAAAGLTFGIGQVLFATLRSPWSRAAVAAAYAAPAAVAGYSAVYGVSRHRRHRRGLAHHVRLDRRDGGLRRRLDAGERPSPGRPAEASRITINAP